jgi:hypothetical protein
MMRTTDTTTCTETLGRPSQPPSVAAAYRHLAVVVLGLDPDTLIRNLRAERSSWTNIRRLTASVQR